MMLEAIPPVAPAIAMETSTRPWVLARVASGTVSVMIAVPATRPKFQPRPSRARASARSAAESPGATAARMPAVRRVIPEAAAIFMAP
jgi:hypothetical protein